MDKLKKLDILSSIKDDIRLKKIKKMLKIAIGIIPILIILSIFFPIIFAPLLVLIPFDIACLLSWNSEKKCIKKRINYKELCESYIVLKNKKNKVYKVFTNEGETIYLEDMSELELDLEKFDAINNDSKETTNEMENKTKKVEEQKKNPHSSIFYLLSEEKQNFNKAIGRDKELDLLEESLVMESLNPLIIGPSGVGKTSLVKGLVYRIQKGLVDEELKTKKIIEVSATSLISGCKYIGEFEEKMEKFIKLAKKENAIVFIDEFHAIMGLGQGEHSNIDCANILKSYLSNGDIKIIGATTEEEYNKIIKKDSAFARRFEIIRLEEPKAEMLYEIVKEHVLNYEKRYNLKFGNDDIQKRAIIESLIELTSKSHRKYDSEKKNPTLILNIIERAFVKARRNKSDFVTVTNICDSIKSNQDLYETAIIETIYDINNLVLEEVEEEKVVQKIIKFSNKNL